MSTTAFAPRIRSLYRRLLRELPTRSPASLLQPSPLQQRIRHQISTLPEPSQPAESQPPLEARIEKSLVAADQYVQYLKAQRAYTTLLERYNPGMNMSEESRIRLTARRVGMELPVEVQKVIERMGGKGGGERDV